MTTHSTIEEVRRLQSCINDLVSLLALPVMWLGDDAPDILGILLEALLGVLRLDFAYARLHTVAGEPACEVVRVARGQQRSLPPEEMGRVFAPWLTQGTSPAPCRMPNPVGDGEVTMAHCPLGLEGGTGAVVVGARRADFPTTFETLLLKVAANQAAVALRGARLLHERTQAEIALQQAHAVLEQRVQERTAALHREMAERQRLEREAQRAEHFALLGRLAAGISHEIRNPLGAVFLHVDLLAEELQQPSPESPTVLAEALAEIKTNLVRLDDLVQDYLSLVRVRSIQREVQDLGAAAQAWGAEMQAEVAVLGVIVQRQSLADLGPVAFHASTLRRALLNLVHNAADAMPQGGTVTLAGQGTATHVQLEVQDTGSGIPAERLAQIFEPLYTTKPGGTGLGLYIVHEIVAAHDGQITVASTEGQGTTVTLTLPRAASAASIAHAGKAGPER